MATGVSNNLDSQDGENELISLKVVEDCQFRVDKLSKIFNDPETETQDLVQLKIHMTHLEKLLNRRYGGIPKCSGVILKRK